MSGYFRNRFGGSYGTYVYGSRWTDPYPDYRARFAHPYGYGGVNGNFQFALGGGFKVRPHSHGYGRFESDSENIIPGNTGPSIPYGYTNRFQRPEYLNQHGFHPRGDRLDYLGYHR